MTTRRARRSSPGTWSNCCAPRFDSPGPRSLGTIQCSRGIRARAPRSGTRHGPRGFRARSEGIDAAAEDAGVKGAAESLRGAVGTPAQLRDWFQGFEDVGIDQKLGAQLPLNTHFRDESGNDITLRDCFRGRPVILTLVYYKCPALCTLVLNDLTRAMNALSETCGKDFDIVTISFNPDETPALASDKKRQYLRAYRRPSAEGRDRAAP